MYVRVVRFTDVDPERLRRLLERIEGEGEPPPGVNASRMQFLLDEAQRTAVSLQYYETQEDMEAGSKVLGAMDPSDTPGTRASVDACVLKLEM
jgi:hypothetical protein